MKASTRLLQAVSALLGLAFPVVGGVVLGGRALESGLLIGGACFMASVLLGADASSPAASASRRLYKCGLLLVIVMFGGVSAGSVWNLTEQGRWLDLLVTALKISCFVGCALLVLFDEHPRARQLLEEMGFRSSKSS